MEEKENKKEEQKNNAVTVIEKPETNEEKQENLKEITSNNEKKSKLGLILVIGVIVIILLLSLFSTIFAVINIGNEKIIKGIEIDEIDVSKMTKEETKTMLEDIYSKKIDYEIYLKHGEFESSTTYNALEVQYQIDKAIEQAYEIGRKGNLFKDNFEILRAWTEGTQIDLDVTIDEEMLNQVAENINNSIEGAVVQPDYYKEGENLIITTGKEGLKVEESQLFQKIYEIVKKRNTGTNNRNTAYNGKTR